MSVTPPVLDTERLTMRAPALSDLEALVTFYGSERAAFVGGPQSRELTWRSLAQEIGHWQMLGFGRWTLVEKSTGAPVGIVGLWRPEGFPENELGWDLFEGATGKGYATEAARTARRYAYDVLGWTTLISLIANENHASERVAERLGATYDYDFTHERFGPLRAFRHPGPNA